VNDDDKNDDNYRYNDTENQQSLDLLKDCGNHSFDSYQDDQQSKLPPLKHEFVKNAVIPANFNFMDNSLTWMTSSNFRPPQMCLLQHKIKARKSTLL
jgi:hypothetical protein